MHEQLLELTVLLPSSWSGWTMSVVSLLL